MQFTDDHHASEEDVERYALGRLTETDLAQFEEHLLICAHCQDRVAHEDAIRQGIRDAASLLPQKHKTTPRWTLPRRAWGFGLAFAILTLAVVLPTFWRSTHHVTLHPATVLLQSMRGAETTPATAPAEKSITLVVDVTELPVLAMYTIHVVDARGHEVFHSQAVAQNNKLQTVLDKGLAVGTYFVRVYSPAPVLLREFSLIVTD